MHASHGPAPVTLEIGLVAVGALGVLVVLASRATRHLPISEPLLALLVGVALGPEVLDQVRFSDPQAVLHALSEVVIAIALMAVALRFPFATVRSHARPVVWMLALGMLGMAAIVAGLAWWVLGVALGPAVLLGGVLAPTDPVLSSSVVSGDPAERTLSERIRTMISVESGLNDGLALPIVVAGTVMVLGEGIHRFAVDGLASVAIALVLGPVIGGLAGLAFRRIDEAYGIEHSAFFVFTLVLALLALGAVNLARGDGILAVFLTGLTYNAAVGSKIYEDEREVEEGVNRVLVLPVFVLFGVVLPWSAWGELGQEVAVFAVAVLVLRRLPVVFALKSALRLDVPTAAFYGWFGPMGVAALFFVTLAHEHDAAPGPVWPATAAVVAASTVAHGLTAAPARRLYGQVVGDRGDS